MASHHALSSGEHSLPGAGLAGAICLPVSTPLIGADDFLRLGAALPEEKIPKNYHLRPLRLRRSSPARHALSSGKHSLPEADIAGTSPLPMSTPLIGAGDFLL